MPRFAANVSLLYPEHALLDRIFAAARDGFAAVEVQVPYAVEPQEFRRALDAARTQLVLINAPQGDAADERGLAALPGRERDFEQSIEVALDYARRVGARRVHVMAGIVPSEVGIDEATAVYCRNLSIAGSALAAHGIAVVIEPINTRDMPGYFLTQPEQAARLISAIGAPNVRLQFDCYHAQIMGGDLARRLEKHFPLIGHVQVAGVPDRGEPDVGEVNYAYLFALLDRLGYDGWVGCEYRPAGGTAPGATSAGLRWLRSP
jgi:2-dehydrotetronate isomerase